MKPTIEMHEDGGATISFPEGYMGTCGKCLTNDATREVYVEFLTPIPAKTIEGMDFPECKGVNTFYCDSCEP
jgi:hypothetical protein